MFPCKSTLKIYNNDIEMYVVLMHKKSSIHLIHLNSFNEVMFKPFDKRYNFWTQNYKTKAWDIDKKDLFYLQFPKKSNLISNIRRKRTIFDIEWLRFNNMDFYKRHCEPMTLYDYE